MLKVTIQGNAVMINDAKVTTTDPATSDYWM
jgi:hypothetical protein